MKNPVLQIDIQPSESQGWVSIHPHELTLGDGLSKKCNLCCVRAKDGVTYFYRCDACGYELCPACFACKRRTSPSADGSGAAPSQEEENADHEADGVDRPGSESQPSAASEASSE